MSQHEDVIVFKDKLTEIKQQIYLQVTVLWKVKGHVSQIWPVDRDS